ncbi:MAG: hypothetical protein OXF79_22910 [Chloroflexi bacterium]|nr:hypothetical protein [Chloroflexota bacterium]
MSMGKQGGVGSQEPLWVSGSDLPRSAGHPFHERLNAVLESAGDVETHGKVFGWVLGVLAESGLVSGKTVGVDATTLEVNAALRSIVRRDTAEDYDTFVRGLAESSGVATPTRADLARFDRKRKKKLPNAEWENPTIRTRRSRR